MKPIPYLLFLVLFFLMISTNSFGQNFKVKGGIYGFPHIETDGKNTYAIGKGGLLGLEWKASGKFTIQVDYSITCLKFNIHRFGTLSPKVRYHYDEFITLAEFRYYPSAAFEQSYFGLTAAVYTDRQSDNNNIFGGEAIWKDSGYKWGLLFGHICRITDKFDLEPQVVLWFDLGRYPSTDELFGYARLQYGVSLSYKL